MSNPAQEEADRLFNHKPNASSHPEDADADSDQDIDSGKHEVNSHSRIRAGREKPNLNSDKDSDDDDTSPANMATLSPRRSTYTVPSQMHYANTGPKGVIADAQNYHQARRSTFRRTLHSISNNLSFGRPRTGVAVDKPPPVKRGRDGHSSGSDIDIPTDEDEDEFMTQWREQRLAELQDQYGLSAQNGRSQQRSPGQRTYGTMLPVNAQGYLSAVESSPPETTVIVLLYDPDQSTRNYEQSKEVEEELEMLAYKYNWVRFVKLHHQVAEMESLDIPGVLAYRGGDVFATISGAQAEGLEDGLLNQGAFVKR